MEWAVLSPSVSIRIMSLDRVNGDRGTTETFQQQSPSSQQSSAITFIDSLPPLVSFGERTV